MMRYSTLIAVVLSLCGFSAIAAPGAKEAAKPSSERLRELQKERVKVLKEQIEGQMERVTLGKDPLLQLIEAVRELADAELDLAENPSQRVSAVERLAAALSVYEKQISDLHQAGLQNKQNVAQIKAARLKAEIQLEKMKLAK